MPTSKNILYVGPYRQSDGWGLASKDYLLSLLTTNHNVASVPIYLNRSAICKISDKEILDSENVSFSSYDIVIQQNLPQCFAKVGHDNKNIGMLFLENNKLVSDGCFNLNTLDEIWVTTEKEQKCLSNSKVNTPSKKVSHPLPTESIKNCLNNNITKKDNSYKFYFIGEYIQRKNIKDIVAAFHLEFHPSEPVELIIKTSLPGLDPNSSEEKIRSDFDQIKKRLRIRSNFRNEVIITEKLSEEKLFMLHRSCDCFVSASYGEAFCRPAAEALCFGNPVILAQNIGAVEMCDKEDCGVVSCQEQPVIMEDNSYISGIDMYNGYETWSVPSILDLQKQMRSAYETRAKVDGSKYIDKFSYKNIGSILCQYIQ
jgi:glycosyltransferase involved in cell wall biosynthesis